jgi:hypothetical protein
MDLGRSLGLVELPIYSTVSSADEPDAVVAIPDVRVALPGKP